MSPLIFRITNIGPGLLSSTGTIKNSRLSFTEMDGNLVYLESLANSKGFTVSLGLTFSNGILSVLFDDSGTSSSTIWSAEKIINQLNNLVGSGIYELNGLSSSTQYLSKTTDDNIIFDIVSSGKTHSFNLSLDLNNLSGSLSGEGLTSSGDKINILYGYGLTVSNNIIQLDSNSAGNGLSFSGGVYSLNFNDTGTNSTTLWSAEKITNLFSNNSITNLNGLTSSSQFLTASGDENILLNVSSIGKTHSFSSSINFTNLANNLEGSGLTSSAGKLSVVASNGITVSNDSVQINPNLANYGLSFSNGLLDVNFNYQIMVDNGTFSSGVLTLNRQNGSNILIPIIPDWSTSTYYRTKDLVIGLYESEYRIFRALSSFTASGTPFPGSQSIAMPTNSYTGQWQEVSPLRGNMSNVIMTGPVAYQSSLTPPTFTGASNTNVNDYNPTGLSNTNFLRISAQTNHNITGLQAPNPVQNQAIYICNVGTASITFKKESSLSLATNRFLLGGDKNLQENEGIMLIYDDITLRWRSEAMQI